MPYQVFGARSGATAVAVTCTRSATARSSGVIFAMASSTACSPSAFLAPFFPSERSSAARSFIAARSSALKPWDSVSAFFTGISGVLSSRLGQAVLPALRKEARAGQAEVLLDSCSDRVQRLGASSAQHEPGTDGDDAGGGCYRADGSAGAGRTARVGLHDSAVGAP